MQNTTLLFLIKKKEDEISHICLAMKKRSFGVGRWNGVGGKLLPGETLEQGLRREAEEEIGIVPKNLLKRAELNFTFPYKDEWNQIAHVYFCENWDNEPQESEEMNPKWFSVDELPFENMWPDDVFWLLRILKGESVRGNFTLGEGDVVLEQKVELVQSF